MSWEEMCRDKRACPCGAGYYAVIERSDDWGRSEELWEMLCSACKVDYGLYTHKYNHNGFTEAYHGWLPKARIVELEAAGKELARTQEAVSLYARSEFSERWNKHFAGESKKSIWGELTENGKHYPSLNTFYQHIRDSSLQQVLDRYFEWPSLPTIVRVLQLCGCELQSRIEEAQKIERLLEEQDGAVRTKAFR